MKVIQHLIRAMGLFIFESPFLFAQNLVTVDPAEPLVDFVSLAEWSTNGDQEGWVTDGLAATVVNGSLSGTASGNDTKLILNPISPSVVVGSPSVVTVEFALTRSATDATQVQLFWSDASGGFAELRSLSLSGAQVPSDGLPHVYRFEIRSLNTDLRGLRIDASQSGGVPLEFDYVRLRTANIMPVVDPAQALTSYRSLGEWNNDGDQEGWIIRNVSSPSVAGGKFSGVTVGNDPRVTLNNLSLDTTTGNFDVVEIRFRRESNDTSRVDLFWADDNGNISPDRRAFLPAGQWPSDDQFHLLQIPLGDFTAGTITRLRFDPVSDTNLSRDISLDYVRIGTFDPPSGPTITAFRYDSLFDEIEIVWTSIQGRIYMIESSPDLSEESWTPAVTALQGDAGTTSFLGSPGTNDRFFRVIFSTP